MEVKSYPLPGSRSRRELVTNRFDGMMRELDGSSQLAEVSNGSHDESGGTDDQPRLGGDVLFADKNEHRISRQPLISSEPTDAMRIQTAKLPQD